MMARKKLRPDPNFDPNTCMYCRQWQSRKRPHVSEIDCVRSLGRRILSLEKARCAGDDNSTPVHELGFELVRPGRFSLGSSSDFPTALYASAGEDRTDDSLRYKEWWRSE